MNISIESRAAAYLAKMPHAISGAGGHRATFAAACKLREFGLSFEQAEQIFARWNETHCQPKWPASALRHKLVDAWRHTTPRPEYKNIGQRGIVTHRVLAGPGLSRPCVTAQGDKSLQLAATLKALLKERPAKTKTARAAGIQLICDSMKSLRLERNINTLAQIRGLQPMAIRIAFRQGLIRFGNHNYAAAWFILDRSLRVASARRMDGHSWFEGTPNKCKALMLPGSQAKWPIGIREAQSSQKILLVEGAPDLLAAFQIAMANSECAPVAMLSASCPIHAGALRLFTGKRIRIYAHNDSAGQSAAAKWASQIKHRAAVDIFSMARYGVKDLNEFVKARFNAKDILP